MDFGEIVLVLVAVAVGFFIKGIVGIGGPLLAIPVLASFTGVEYAVAVVAVPTFVANVWMLWDFRAAAASMRRYLVPLLIAGTVGTLVGAWILVSVDDRVLSFTLALFVIAYIIWFLTNGESRLSDRNAERLTIPVGLVTGGLQGATGISSPVLATYMHSMRLERARFIFAITVPFLVLGVVQIVAMGALGAYTGERTVAALLAVIPVVVALPLGLKIGARFSQRAFEMGVLVMLGITAIRLLWLALA